MTIMNTSTSALISLFVATIFFSCANGDPTAKINFKKVDTKVIDNPYFGAVEAEIHPPGDTISFKVPVKKDLPPTLMMRATAQYAGSDIGEIDMPFCESFNDEMIGKSILNSGTPNGKFPKACPVVANGDYMISKYTVPSDKIPPGLPDGLIIGDVECYEPGKDPYITIHAELALIHKMPGLGR